MTETAPTCRTCYAHTLSDDEGARFLAEPLTHTPHYCERHQKAIDDLHALVIGADVTFIKATRPTAPFQFPRIAEGDA